MSKIYVECVLALVLSVALSGCGLPQFLEQDSEHERIFAKKTKAFQERLDAKGRAIRAKSDIASGEEVKVEKLEDVETELYRIPIDAISSMEQAGDRSVKHEILAGQVLCQHDLITRLPQKAVSPLSEAAKSAKGSIGKK